MFNRDTPKGILSRILIHIPIFQYVFFLQALAEIEKDDQQQSNLIVALYQPGDIVIIAFVLC